MSALLAMPDAEENLIVVLKIIAKKSGLFIAKMYALELDGHQFVAIRDHTKGSINALYRIKQALGAFSPGVKNVILPSNICKHVSSMEKEGVIPSKLIDVNCSITKVWNKRGMRTFY